MTAEERLLENLAKILRVPRASLSMATNAADVPTWESMAVVEMVFMLKREFNVAMKMEDATGLTSVENVAAVLRAAGKF